MNRRGLALTSSAHLVDDLYQGVVPAMLPFFVIERGYSYASVAGLALAASLLSSIAQPAFGWWTDRRQLRWLIPAGMTTAAVGVALAGYLSSYLLTWLVLALVGLGVAAFHPEATRAARQATGDNNKAMSVFALGGNAGFAVGALVATPLFMATGLRGSALLLVPAGLMALLVAARLGPVLDGADGSGRAALPIGDDDWPAFLRLTGLTVVRSILFSAVTSFVALYFIKHLGASTGEGGAALTAYLVAGAVGTLIGGWVADRTRPLTCVRLAFALSGPALVGLVIAPNRPVAWTFITLRGMTMFMPFGVFLMLGQDYLPNRIGTASGLTGGLAVTIGGLFAPVLGWVADLTNLRFMLGLLIILPPLALLIAASMQEPKLASSGRFGVARVGAVDALEAD
jgi:FSR family fosmidomycin resistance protein-like MFS transporter